MRTLNYVVLVLVLASFGFVSFGCGDSDSPTAPSVMQEAPSVRATAPSTPVMGATPASFDADLRTVAPGDACYGPNAYDFYAHMDSGMLHVALVEDAMQTMRTASQPHRMRQVDVYHVTSEPRHVLQTHGDPLYSGSVRLSGRLELPPIDIASCAPHEWIIVQAAELSDDRYDGWRNAPCPQPNGVVSGSDGSGPGWAGGQYGPPPRVCPKPEPEDENGTKVNGTNSAPTITNPGDRNYRRGDRVQFTIPVVDPDEGDTVTVTVSGLPSGLVWQPDPGRVAGTVAMDAALQPYRVRVEATDGKASRSLTFTITIGDRTNGPRTNRAPDIVVSPGSKSYQQGQTIPAFSIDATDPDEGDTARITSVSGLPEDLVWRSGSVSGTVAMDAAVRDYPVTVTATDGKDTASLTFTITITAGGGNGGTNRAPDIVVSPGSKSYQQGQTIPAFSIDATDPDEGDTARITSVSGLPEDLVWRSGSVSGTVAMATDVRDYPVTVTATDGKETASLTFTITITAGGGGGRTPRIPSGTETVPDNLGTGTTLRAGNCFRVEHGALRVYRMDATREQPQGTEFAGHGRLWQFSPLRFINGCDYPVGYAAVTNSVSWLDLEPLPFWGDGEWSSATGPRRGTRVNPGEVHETSPNALPPDEFLPRFNVGGAIHIDTLHPTVPRYQWCAYNMNLWDDPSVGFGPDEERGAIIGEGTPCGAGPPPQSR